MTPWGVLRQGNVYIQLFLISEVFVWETVYRFGYMVWR